MMVVSRILCTLSLVVGAALSLGIVAHGEDEVKPSGKPKNLREYIDAATEWYEVFPNSEAKEPAKVVPTLRWVNNVRGSDDGVTVLYVHDGVPLAAACVFPWRERLYHCFESLSRDNIVARQDGVPIWEPQKGGVTFAEVPGAMTPKDSRMARLRQMKDLAQRFQATMTVKAGDNTNREELRMLSKELFRYDPSSGDVIDGAVFAFVMGTDPEALLLLEAVKTGDKTAWQFAFARRTFCKLECRLDEKIVWEVPQYPGQDDPKDPHYTLGVPLPPDIAAEQSKLEKSKGK